MAALPLIELPEVNFDTPPPILPSGGVFVPGGTVNPGGSARQAPGPNDAFFSGTPLPHSAFLPGSLDVPGTTTAGIGGTSGDTGLGTAGLAIAGLDPGALANPSTTTDPTTGAIIPGTSGNPVTQGAGALAAVASWATDKGLRFGLIALGILLVLVAAWGFVKGDVDTKTIAKAAAAA
jgi:hypothetical protein